MKKLFFLLFYRFNLCWAVFSVILCVGAQAKNENIVRLNIAVAANFLHAFNDIQSIYEKQTGVKLVVSSGSTGQLYHQIRFGAPFDIFLSADKQTSLRLIQEELAVATSYYIYGRGRIVLWSWDETLSLDNGEILKAFNKHTRIAMANPKVAPYGKAAQDVLAALEVGKQWQHNIITGQNITQTYQFIASRNVKMGFVSLAQLRFAEAREKQTINYWLVPHTLHQPIEQTAVLLEASEKKSQSMHFLKFLQTPTALAIMQQYGYE